MPMSTITVAGINPGLKILGATQQLNYDQQLSALQITNSFIPSISIPSQFNMEYRNNLLSGFRWTHLTTNTDTYGSLTLQSFVNAQAAAFGNNMIEFNSSGVTIFVPLNLNSQIITNGTWEGNNITVPYGGTGLASTTPFSVICGGTGPIASLQSVASLGTTGQVLTSQGADALPIWTTNGIGTITSITAGTGLSGGVITTSGTIDIATTAVTAGNYTYGSFTVNAQGQLTAASNGANPVLSTAGTATRISSTGGQNPIIDLIDTAITPGSYTNANLTVDSAGRLTTASNGIIGVLASLYMSGNLTTTTITTSNTFYKIAGSTTAIVVNNFSSPMDNQLQYTGSNPIDALISVNISVTHAEVGGSTIGLSIFKNGTIQIAAANYTFQLTANKATSLSLSVYVPFITTDFVEVFITYDTGANPVLITDMNLIVTI